MLTRIYAAFAILALLVLPVWAQESTPEQKKIAELEAQNKALTQQLAAKQPPVSAEEQLKRMQQSYVMVFAQLKARAQPGCKAAGGKLSIALTATGSVASLTCVLK